MFVLAAIYLNLQPSQGITVQDSVKSVILQDGRNASQQKSIMLQSMREVLSIRDQQRKRQTAEFGSCSQNEFLRFFEDYSDSCTRRLRSLAAIDTTDLSPGEIASLQAAFFCDPDCGQPFVDAYFACDLEGLAQYTIGLCGTNEDGDRCGDIVDNIIAVLSPAEDVCLPRSSVCSIRCRNALETASDAVGCCVNIFNTTEFEEDIGNPLIDEFALWSSCGVDTPGFCPSTLTSGALRVAGTLVGLISLVLITAVF